MSCTFKISLRRAELAGLHEDGQRDHVAHDDGEGQAHHEDHGQGPVQQAAAAGNTGRGPSPLPGRGHRQIGSPHDRPPSPGLAHVSLGGGHDGGVLGLAPPGACALVHGLFL